jgi:outer membrane protein assembly factor BamC
MRLLAKTIVVSASLAVLSGCSTIQNTFGTEGSYREDEAKLVKKLEMPPNLFNPAKPRTEMSLALQKAEQDALADKDTYDHIPNFKASGLRINSNLSERWVEIESENSEQVWSSLKRFFVSRGFTIETERKDIGLMKTDYVSRTDIAPLDDQGPLTRFFNSWRDTVADGIYDKFIARVETDLQAGLVKVFVNHNEMWSPDANEAKDIDQQWRLRPFNPAFEAEALYQVMVFFGSSSEQALAQLKITEQQVEIVDGEELGGLAFRTSMDQAWTYLQAMIYRAAWSIDKVKANNNELWVAVPKSVREESGLFSGLAFWRDADKKDLPELIKLKLEKSDADQEKVILKASSPEGDKPLNASQRRYIFESLGLLPK